MLLTGFPKLVPDLAFLTQHLAIFVEQRQKICHSFVNKKNNSTERYELKLKHELLICETISSPNTITIRHLNRKS